MADAIVRLRVESSEYDQKLSRATQQLQHMEKEVRRTGATFAYADKEEIAFIQSLGSMETKADSAKGKIAEMTKSFTELSLQYNRLTKEEKKSPYGKALASSLDQLKGRIKNAKSEMTSIEGSLNGFGDVAKQAASKLGLPVEQLGKFGPYGAAAAVALKVAGDAFKQNELLMDEWGRQVESVKGLYHGFLNALNTGDFSSFLKNMDNIIFAARSAYDALDELGTFNAFNQINAEKARTNFTEATANYREGTGSKEDVKAAGEALKKEMQTRQQKEQDAYVDAIKELAASRGVDEDLLKRVLEGEYGDYETLKSLPQTSQASGRGRGRGRGKENQQSEGAQKIAALSEMLNKLSDDELARIQGLGLKAQQTATEVAGIDKQMARILSGKEGDETKTVTVPVEPVIPEGSAAALKKQITELQKKWDVATTDEERAGLKAQIDAANEALKSMTPQVDGAASAIKNAASMWKEHSDKIKDVKTRLAEFQEMMANTSLSDEQREWAEGMAKSYQEQLDKMTNATEEAADEISDSLEEIPTKFEMIQEALNRMSTGVSAISTIGNAFNDLKGIGEDLSDAFSGNMDAWDAMMTVFNSGIGVLQTVMGVMEAINTLQELAGALSDARIAKQTAETTAVVAGKGAEAAAESAEATASGAATSANTAEAAAGAGKAMAGIPIVGPVLAIAAVAAVLAAVLAATSKAKSAGNYAVGGIVPGSSFSGDNLTANVNSGELILNRAQQGAIAGQLESNPMGNIQVDGIVKGHDILLAASNYARQINKQAGMGHLGNSIGLPLI